jgi:hypothetical protein
MMVPGLKWREELSRRCTQINADGELSKFLITIVFSFLDKVFCLIIKYKNQ